VQVLRNDVGLGAQLQILALIGAGRTFEESYGAVTGRQWADFAASVPARLRALAVSPGIAFAPDSTAGSGANGPTFIIYGYAPNATVTLSITGAATGFTNSSRSQVLDEFGVYLSWLGTNWPADTYTFTLTSSGAPTVTKSVTKAP
jgi:hypothetical protein